MSPNDCYLCIRSIHPMKGEGESTSHRLSSPCS